MCELGNVSPSTRQAVLSQKETELIVHLVTMKGGLNTEGIVLYFGKYCFLLKNCWWWKTAGVVLFNYKKICLSAPLKPSNWHIISRLTAWQKCQTIYCGPTWGYDSRCHSALQWNLKEESKKSDSAVFILVLMLKANPTDTWPWASISCIELFL